MEMSRGKIGWLSLRKLALKESGFPVELTRPKGELIPNKQWTNSQQTVSELPTNGEQTHNKRWANSQQTVNEFPNNDELIPNKRWTNSQPTLN